jgi:hypothetical protein
MLSHLATFYPGLVISVPLILLGLGFILYRWAMTDKITLEYFKMLFGFMLLLMIGTIACVIAIGDLATKTSEGLNQVLTIVSVLSGGFAQWAFTPPKTPDDKDTPNGKQ